MSIAIKYLFVFLVPVIMGIGVAVIINLPNSAERFYVSGKVVSIEWKSSNHESPKIEIKKSDGKIKVFSDYRIILDVGQLKVGDSLIKKIGSKSCLVNDVTVQCVN